MAKVIVAGDRVRKNSGSPELVVRALIARDRDGEKCAVCNWLDVYGQLQEAVYPLACLHLQSDGAA